jgi:CSLREA domain-containing protein
MKTRTWITRLAVFALLVASFGVMPYKLSIGQAATRIYVKPDGSNCTRGGSTWTTSCEMLAASLVVNTLEDELNADGDCSLREAITAATGNTTVDACGTGSSATDTITFSVSGKINLGAELNVAAGGPMLIDGKEAISVSGQDSVRVFFVGPGGAVTLLNLTIIDGAASDGAGIRNFGALNLDNCEVTSNNADYDGGGIMNNGILDIEDSLIQGNSAAWGGGLSNHNTVTVVNSSFSNNQAGSKGGGGGISNAGIINITSSILDNNSGSQGGGIHNGESSLLTLANSTLASNSAYDGGGILNHGTMDISESSIYSNNSLEYGGGLVNSDILTLTASTLSANIAVDQGGGIYSSSGTINITNSTLSGNNASWGGGISNHGTLAITNGTLFGNSADHGGGIADWRQTVIYNTILAGNSVGGNCQWEVTDGGHNLEDTDTCGLELAKGSLINSDPLLGELSDNGGLTLTHSLHYGSPAIDAAASVYCLDIDQRGIQRPIDGNNDGFAVCDIGSVEAPKAVLSDYFLPLVVRK